MRELEQKILKHPKDFHAAIPGMLTVNASTRALPAGAFVLEENT